MIEMNGSLFGSDAASSGDRSAGVKSTILWLVFASVYFYCTCFPLNSACAGLILDDFDDDEFGETTPLESFRSYEDFFTEMFGQSPLVGGLFLSQDPGFEAILRYNFSTGFDFTGFDRLVLKGAFLGDNVTATLKANSSVVASGLRDLDIDGLDIIAFEITSDMGVLDELSFHFATSADFTFSVNSTALIGSSSVTAVPEPSSIVLMGLAFACGAGKYRLRKWRKPLV